MLKNIFTCFALMLATLNGYSQAFFTKADENRIQLRNADERTIIPDKYEVYSLNMEEIKKYLLDVPMEFSGQPGLKIQIPIPDKTLQWFEVYDSPVLMPGIAARYPSIKSYKAYGVSDRSLSMRFAISPLGFYAAIHTIEGEVYIDPYSEENIKDYIVYYVADHKSETHKNVPLCGTDHDLRPHDAEHFPINNRTDQVILREYRLAMACTGEWGNNNRRRTVEKCLADINTMVTRLNSIFENEVAIRFRIIDDNDKLIFLDSSTDPYGKANKGFDLVYRNTDILNSLLPNGHMDYDVGHVLAVCYDIGGVVAGGTCNTSNKGNGVTCHTNNDLSGIVSGIMAHEIGHQFDASHTWNICKGIEDQRAANWAYEPGSGSTILSYAGSCGSDNVGSRDAYFHVGSMIQMFRKTTPGGVAWDCANKIVTDNHQPVAIVPTEKYVIPMGTPFVLTGSGYDEDGDNITYCWEQYDLGPIQDLGVSDNPIGPLFRSIKPAENANIRFFPKPESILTGQTAEKTESLPTVARTLNFKLTVRDNNPIVRGVSWEDYSLEVTDKAGPFKITYPVNKEFFTAGQIITVTWDVANTDKAPVNCKKVNIYASYSSAIRDDDPNLVLLASEVDNNGTYIVTIPDKTTNLFRIIIKAADHIILTSSSFPSPVLASTNPTVFVAANKVELNVCQPDEALITYQTVGLSGADEDIRFEVIADSLPLGTKASLQHDQVKPGENNFLVISSDDIVGSQEGEVIVLAIIEGRDTITMRTKIYIEGGDINHVQTLSPANGVEGLTGKIEFEWESKPDAISYLIEIATNPDFSDAHLVERYITQDTLYNITSKVNESTIYYWRVRADNNCKTGIWSDVQAFFTVPVVCRTYQSGLKDEVIASSANSRAEIPLTVDTEGIITDLNISLIRATHGRLVDLTATLVSPEGKEARLWSGKCGNQQNVNVKLDDDAIDFFQCPINNGKTYRTDVPGGANKLDIFNGDPIQGVWTLRLDDRVAGQGGRFHEFNMEICSDIDVQKPYLVNNNRLEIHPGDTRYIAKELLESLDDDNSASELIYTLVSNPAHGKVILNGSSLNTGATFTQEDLNNNNVLYEADEDFEGTVYFSFTVYDGNGGWISITNFEIFIDQSIPVSTADILLEKEVFVYPNPVNKLLNIVLSEKVSTFSHFVMTDIAGRTVMNGQLNGALTELDIKNLDEGMYILRLLDGKRIISRKVVVMK